MAPDHPSPSATPGRSIFERLGAFSYRRRWWIVGAWLVLLGVALPLAPRASGALRAGGFDLADLESSRARALLHDQLGLPESALVLVYSSDTAEAGQPAFDLATAAARSAVATAPYVAQVLSYPFAPSQVSADGRTAYDVVLLNIDPDNSPAALPAIQERLAALPAGAVTIALAGGPAFYGDIQTVSENDLRRSEFVSLPLAAIALLFVFGSAVAAGVPLAVGGAAVVVSLAAIFVVASFTEMSIFVLNLATLLGLGLGVDYSLLMTSRFREELRRRSRPEVPGWSPEQAVAGAIQATVATAGRAVFFSGLTVLLGLLGLVLFEFTILRSVGIAGAIVVGVAALAALTLLPAILSIIGSRIDRAGRSSPGPRTEHERALGPPRSLGDAPPGAGLRRHPGPPPASRRCRSCTSCRTPRTRRSCRPACPRESPSTGSMRRSGRAASRRSRWRSRRPDRRPARRTWPPCTTTRGGSRPIPGSRPWLGWWTSIRA